MNVFEKCSFVIKQNVSALRVRIKENDVNVYCIAPPSVKTVALQQRNVYFLFAHVLVPVSCCSRKEELLYSFLQQVTVSTLRVSVLTPNC